MIECQSCTAPTELYLCAQCTDELRAELISLARGPKAGGRPTAGLLEALNDVVTRQTCMGGGTGHRKRGDELPDPFEPHTSKSELADDDRWTKLTKQGQASELLSAARNSLGTIVHDVLESRGLDLEPAFLMADKGFIGPLLPGWRRMPSGWCPTTAEVARWLAVHVHAIACDESAGTWKREIDALARKIKRAIDRPPAPRFCGQCDTRIDRKICGLMLYARREAIEVTCSQCRITHNIDALYNRWLNSIDYRIATREELIGNQRAANPELYDTGIMGALDEPVSWQQFSRWCRERHLKPVRYMRPNGRRGFFRHSDQDIAEYRVGDVRRVRRKMAQQNPVKRGKVKV
ncbi:hypothetical protein MMRN_38630 [Mycobacterium marinum]|uniref:hypothetical protein n=2 Tax=Mycobacterium marinum TaxID=1781 RepID=UPI000DC6F970|nr:hypothetical protein [Mycobacterium marinum]AXN50959.1 hypothetical protein CCUG20998_03557 [Mycobacterium marinum]RFZ33842.1 hypothetical protein NCTC2275_02688 [Mycobacterium marinum]BBC66967.1 hypothetical protein MMRN_38630 [Mycobacterium marinum]